MSYLFTPPSVKDYKDDANRSMEAMKEDLGHRIDGTMAAIKEGRSESNANSKRLEDHMDRNSARLEDYVRELNRDVKGILSDQGALKERVGRQHEELKKAQ
ncbi:MAG: hypothetical protein L6R41_006038 [Letrouitia leprolyta]|nr:MAG: hypothetical protein L6R41_006038 [Letrouitia leprolyta]